ncbi:TadE/TadG family type IV pilus assembly protein [Geminicoccus roseus]|uniref:TadE/TadG family type IV pilus assembly protein n=1 Tax=Geminicoccus roseus TaxID=404900 RepID=UPI0003F594AE|nr:TadE/TadG family type IV pilus assembly protein [Geminicoccus roseus]
MPDLIRPFLRLARDRRGIAALEFAVILPVLALTLMGVIDLGGAIQQSLRLEAAARAGAQYAMSAPTDSAGITAAVRQALPGWNDIVVQPTAMTCVCPGSGATSCTSTSCATALQRFVSITVTRGFSPILLPNFTSVQGSMTLRIR